MPLFTKDYNTKFKFLQVSKYNIYLQYIYQNLTVITFLLLEIYYEDRFYTKTEKYLSCVNQEKTVLKNNIFSVYILKM